MQPGTHLSGIGLYLLAALGSVASAQEFTPIDQATTITTSGHYVVTNNIAGNPAITIKAPSVTLDLNGHTLFPSDHDETIWIDEMVLHVRIHNGVLMGSGIKQADNSHDGSIMLEDISFYGGEWTYLICTPGCLEVTNCRFFGSITPIRCGLGEQAMRGFIRDCTFSGFHEGLRLLNTHQFSIANCSLISGKVWEAPGGPVIKITGHQISLVNNTIQSDLGSGIAFEGHEARVEGNTINVVDIGIAVHEGNPEFLKQSIGSERYVIRDNTVCNCREGIWSRGKKGLYDGNYLSGNVIGFNMLEADKPLFRGNVAVDNGLHDIDGIVDLGGNHF